MQADDVNRAVVVGIADSGAPGVELGPQMADEVESLVRQASGGGIPYQLPYQWLT